MATRRTPDEIVDIVNHCVELEESGGDILAYLWSENYVTPRATWCNFQREWLGRKPYEYTDGKPKNRKEEKEMARIKKDGTPAKKPGPKPNYKKVEKKEPEQLPTVKIDGPIVIKTPDGKETKVGSVGDALNNMADAAADFFGKCEEMGLMKEETKITQPVNYDGFEMIGVRSKETGFRYEYSQEYKIFHVTVGCDSLDLHISDWKRLLDELQKVIPILGVEL